MASIEDFYAAARKWRICIGNIQKTERGVFVQFSPRTARWRGRYRTFRSFNAFVGFLKKEAAKKNSELKV